MFAPQRRVRITLVVGYAGLPLELAAVGQAAAWRDGRQSRYYWPAAAMASDRDLNSRLRTHFPSLKV